MKKTTAILVFMLCLMGTRCSKESYLTPGDNIATATSTSTTSPLKQKSSGNAKYDIPGIFVWHDELNAYQVDFGNAGILTITGSHPYTSPPTPVFEVVSSSVPNSSITYNPINMSFTVTWIVLPTDPEFIVIKEIDDGFGGKFVEEIIINFPPGDPFTLTLSGHLVLIGSDYYAVATEYQIPGNSPVTITVPYGGHKATFVNALNSTYYKASFQYKRNSDVDWHGVPGSQMDLIAGSTYHFQVSVSSKTGYSVPANFSLNIDGGIQSTGGALPLTEPLYSEYPNTATKGGGVDFTVTVSASASYVTINLINDVNSGATLVSPTYRIGSGTVTSFASPIYIPQNSSVTYSGMITCVPGQPQNDQLITPGGTITFTNQTTTKTLTSAPYNGGANGYNVRFLNAIL